ncbi:methylenetetrahydrofolate reductase [Jonesia quinghaiensis]|uniref:methylenetetrahydrofolate reductase n=1 Tax=Jonesia quinghaiensis TaxID=262806 RepID=UPI000413687B|nr:methylenetetrahydrofolate reductase [Jonesia quinghaiensis]
MASFDVSSTARGFHRPAVSFELMPPRNPAAAPKFWNTARKLVEAHPDFVSVTYGAAGGDRNTARTVVETLVKHTNVLPIAHLTCVGATKDSVADTIDDFLAAGARTFLALRGDPPKDHPNWKPPVDGVSSSMDLIALLRDVEAQRCRADASEALRGAAKPLTIAVATFPEGNRDAGTSRQQEAQRLLEKQQAGANFAITQLFYSAQAYTEFVDIARSVGVTIPIVAGILPMTDPQRLRRVEQLTGVPAPPDLSATLESITSPHMRHSYGIAASVELANAVIAAGAPGLHIYTFNKYEPALDLLEGVHLGSPLPAASSQGTDLASWPQDGASSLSA